jgi:predicted RNase H-like HicB family nuclease
MLRYTIVLLPAPEGGYVVHVPALYDAVTEGDTLDQCLARASDLIENTIAVMVERGEDIPVETAPAVVAAVDVPNVSLVPAGSP